MSIIRIYVMTCSSCWLASQLSCMAKTLSSDITCKLFSQFFSYLLCLEAPLTSTIFYHFHWPWPCLGSWGQCKAKLIGFIFLHTFHLLLLHSQLFLWGFTILGENFAVLLLLFFCFCFTCNYLLHQQKYNVGIHSDVYESIWFNLGVTIDTIVFYILMVVFWPWLSFKVTGVRENENLVPIISQSYQSIWTEFVMLLRLLGVINLILILSCPLKGGKGGPTCVILWQKTVTLVFDRFLSIFCDDKDHYGLHVSLTTPCHHTFLTFFIHTNHLERCALLTPLCFQFLASVWRPLAEDLSLFLAPLSGIPYLYLSEKLNVFQLSKRS